MIGVLVRDIEPFSAELLKGVAEGDPRHGVRARRLLLAAGSSPTRPAGSVATSRGSPARSRTASILVTPGSVDARRWSAPADRLHGADNVLFVRAPDGRLGELSRRRLRRRVSDRPRSPADRVRRRASRPRVGSTCGRPPTGTHWNRRGSPSTRSSSGKAASSPRRHTTRRTGSWRSSRPSPMVIFAANDAMALAVISAATARGLPSGRPVGHRLRQRPRVGTDDSAAHDRRTADPADGRGSGPHSQSAARGPDACARAGGGATHAAHRPPVVPAALSRSTPGDLRRIGRGLRRLAVLLRQLHPDEPAERVVVGLLRLVDHRELPAQRLDPRESRSGARSRPPLGGPPASSGDSA